MTTVALVGVLVCALALASCRPPHGEPTEGRAADAHQRCWLPGLTQGATCRWIEIGGVERYVAVLAAPSPRVDALPVYFLAGGPGQSATRVAHAALGALAGVREHHDIVFVDQLGAGGSGPLSCDLDGGRDPIETMLDPELDAEALGRCRAKGPLRLWRYGTRAASDDLDAVRRALGHEKIALYGVSYGSRLALVHLALHGEHVGAAAIDGVMPTEVPLLSSFGEDGQAALDALVADCARDEGCAARFPRFRQQLGALLARRPTRKVEVRHPRTGAPLALDVTPAGLALLVRGLLYEPQLAFGLPFAVSATEAGDFGPLVAMGAALVDGLGESQDVGLMLSVVCREDLPRIDADPALAARAASGFAGAALMAQMREACRVWRADDAPEPASAADLPPTTAAAPSVPLLLLSGARDPVTPARHADVVVAARGGTSLVLPHVGHFAGPHGCGPDVLAAFFAAPGGGPFDLDCGRSTVAPSFWLSALGAGATGGAVTP